MKLILEIDDRNTADSKTADVLVSGRIVGSGFHPHIEWGDRDFSAAEQTARLTEVANGIQKLVKEYYSKDRLLMPYISKRKTDENGNVILNDRLFISRDL